MRDLRIVDYEDGTFAVFDYSEPTYEDEKTVFYPQVAEGFTSRAAAERYIVAAGREKASATILPFPVRETPPMSQLADELRAIATEITQDGPTARRAASLRRIAGWLEREEETALALFGPSRGPFREPTDDELPF
jgi:hypothetical protein